MFGRGRHRSRRGGRRVAELTEAARQAAAAAARSRPGSGPFDEADAPRDNLDRLDLGSMRLPVPAEAQYNVEVDPSGSVGAVHLLTGHGRLTVQAFATPRSEGLWDDMRAELATKLRDESGAAVDLLRGRWGRELQAVTPQVSFRIVGIDGPRWMLRGVAAGPADRHDALVEELYGVLQDTVVVRGDGPLPARSMLPITLPEQMAAQLRQLAAARQEQQQPRPDA